jgi:Fur family transcriptional regulator, zinc uptake regulator
MASRAPKHRHDHGLCLNEALARATQAFEDRGLKLTPLRRQVFEEIASSHDAVGAYDVLDRLIRKTGERMAPISVYRAIDALLDVGVVHRLESRNAFFACHTPHAGKRHIALVCDTCGLVAEIDGTAVFTAIEKTTAAGKTPFTVKRSVVEVAGDCAACVAR